MNKVPGAGPTGLALLHEVKVTMEAELVRMFTGLRKECRTLTPEKQQVVFQFAPNLQNVDDFMQMIPKVDENDDMQMQCHLEALQDLARCLSKCEDQLESLCQHF